MSCDGSCGALSDASPDGQSYQTQEWLISKLWAER